MTSHSQANGQTSLTPSPKEKDQSTIQTRHRRQLVQAPVSPPTQTTSQMPLNKKQRAKQRGRELAQMMKERRERGEVKIRTGQRHRSKSQKAGIYFPISRVLKRLKNLNPNRIVYENSAVLLAGVLEYLTAEMLELAGNVSREFKKHRIIPRHLYLAVENDQELESLLKDTILVQGGALPHIHPSLLTSKTSKIPYKAPKETLAEQEEEEETEPAPAQEQSKKRKSTHQEEENDLTVLIQNTSTPVKKTKN